MPAVGSHSVQSAPPMSGGDVLHARDRMWALRMVAPRKFEAVEVPAPEPSLLPPGQVLLRTLAGGICGSDIPKYSGLKPAPADEALGSFPSVIGFPMHEVVGEVVASRNDFCAVGDYVVGWATQSDALAEYVITDGSQVATYQPGTPPERAVLIQSLACVLYAVTRVPVAAAHVAILGMGPIGLLFAHVMRSLGAARITGVDVIDRSPVAARFGIDQVVCATTADWSAGLPAASRPQLVIEAIGHQSVTLQHAIDSVADCGRVLYFGIPDVPCYALDIEQLMRKNLTLIGGVTRRRRKMLQRANAYLIEAPSLYEDLVTDLLHVSQIQAAFDRAATANADRCKVIVTMT